MIPHCYIFRYIFLIFVLFAFPNLLEGKIPPDEPTILPPLPIIPKSERRRSYYGAAQSKRIDYRDRDWDRERDKDFELMPPPGSHKKEYAIPMDDQPIDPNEPTYCICHQVLFCCLMYSSLLSLCSTM